MKLFFGKMVDRARRTGYPLPYPNGLFSVPAPPLRTRERRGFFSLTAYFAGTKDRNPSSIVERGPPGTPGLDIINAAFCGASANVRAGFMLFCA